MSRELILKMSMSVDGFVCGPNGELDWIFSSSDEGSQQWVVDLLWQAGLHAMGRASYETMAAYWPTSTLPFAAPMNEIPKAVFSRSGRISPPSATVNDAPTADPAVLDSWLHPIVAGTNLVADIQRLKAVDGKPILAHGGASFGSSLIAANLVDVLHLAIHPIALGRGKPLFASLEAPLNLRLEDLKRFEKGVVVKTYQPA